MAALKKLLVSKDSPLRDIGQLNVPFSHSPNQSEDEAEEAEEANDEEAEDKKETKAKVAKKESEAAVRGKSPTLNDQILDLTEEDGDEVSKSTSPKKVNTSETEITTATKSLDIDTELTTKKSAQLSAETKTMPTAEINAPDSST
ncbi:uncharacterized protein LOC114258426 [Camellia sinensis]|uniref:uncharacterized protein LOC114258426 n=1 Tax=Camellia sinensis TaxID=4442 RepID=UPI001035D60E|nr:uncharacterized protein LOC114258426 [Camellia sinensis]